MAPESPKANDAPGGENADISDSSNNGHSPNIKQSNKHSNEISDANASATPVVVPLPLTSGASTGSIELFENFYITNKRKNNLKIQVKLSADGIYLRRETDQHDQINEQLIRLEDIVGSRCGQRLKKCSRGRLTACGRLDENAEAPGEVYVDEKDPSAYLYIYAYVKSEKSSQQRTRTVRILRFRSHNNYEQNCKIAERWHHAICVNKAILPWFAEQKQLLILLNPKSGSGRGRTMFQRQVAPVLKEANVPYELHVTIHPNYAREYVRDFKDLSQRYCGIVVASGDGLFYEVLNGLMDRLDWHRVSKKLPIGIIPCGSGNGLAKSIAHLYNEPYEPKPILYATLTCVSGKSAPMDIVRVEVAKDKTQTEMFSFLSVGWGLIADIDIESEKLRSIGASRFTFWSIHRLISLRTYKGKLSYLPCTRNEKEQQQRKVDSETQTNTDAKQYPPEVQEFHDIPNIPEGYDTKNNGTGATTDDDNEFEDAVSLDSSMRRNTDSWHSATSRLTNYYSIDGQSVRSRRSVLSKLEIANAEFERRRPSTSIPPLNAPLPTDSWHTEEGEYVMVHAAYTTHLASDCFFAPKSRLDDGIIYLVIIRAGVGRSQLVQFLLGMSTGTHLPAENDEHIKVVPVRAFRIEPSPNKDGIMAVDGERVDYGPLQGEILSGIINVMVPNGNAII